MKAAENKGFIYEFGDFVLDARERILFADGHPLRLPAKEFETLLFLVEHNGHAITKEEMMAAIWHDAFVEESNLAKQISRLRKILNTNGQKFIETLPKHGYRFNADISRTEIEPVEQLIVEKRTMKRLTLEVENDSAADLPALPKARRRYQPWIAVAAAVLLFSALAAVVLLQRRTPPANPKSNAIVVLPIKTLNSNEDDRILAAGLTDALVTKLGSLRQIVVRPSRSVAEISEIEDHAEIGRKLGVQNILEGTLHRADGRLRVNLRLVDAQTGEQLWTDKFESEIAGIFELEDRLSEKTAQTFLKGRPGDIPERATKKYTENPEAFSAYLKGRYFWNKRTEDGFRQAISYFDEAVAKDPNYALAYAGLADCYILLGVWGAAPPNEMFPQARQSAEKALSADPDLAEAVTSLAFVEWVYGWNFRQADADFRRAIELNPNYATARHWYSYYLVSQSRSDEAIEEIKKAREIEGPLSLSVNTDIGEIHSWAGRYEEAERYLRDVLKLEPNYAVAHHVLGINLIRQNRVREAIAEEEAAVRLERQPRVLAALGYAYAVAGQKEKARAILEELNRENGKKYVSRFSLGIVHAGLGDFDDAFTCLENSFNERSDTMAIIKIYPLLTILTSDPRFSALAERVGYSK